MAKDSIALTPKKIAHRDNAIADALFWSIGEGAIVIDENGRISRVNEAALRILGFEEDDLLGKWYPETICALYDNGEPIANIDRPITEALITGQPVFRKIMLKAKNGTAVPVALTVSPVLLDEQPVGVIEVFRDISEEIELSNAKDEFISVASHQLRTPATVVKHYLGILLEGYLGDLNSQQRKAALTANEYNDNQLETINNILKVAQADANKIKPVKQPTDLLGLLEQASSAMEDSYRMQKLKLLLQSDVSDAIVSVDPLHIRMVVENLLDNARKYSTPTSKKVVINLSESPKHFTITITDEGIGIKAADLPKLFQKFSRIPNRLSDVNGTGLGLYWARKLIELYDGNITASSKFRKGTTITIELPKGGGA